MLQSFSSPIVLTIGVLPIRVLAVLLVPVVLIALTGLLAILLVVLAWLTIGIGHLWCLVGVRLVIALAVTSHSY